MVTNQQNIIDAVDRSINELCDQFQSYPTKFYTENDLVCFLYHLLRRNVEPPDVYDKDGCMHSLIHTEYPTPFRCDMGGNRFVVKDEADRTEAGGKYQRGHYDIVTLNPGFVRHHTYQEIKAQDYELYQRRVLSNLSVDNPVILYGIEFMFSRDPLERFRGENKERGVDQFIPKVIQDADKLIESRKVKGFMDRVKMLVFVKGSSKDVCSLLSERLSVRAEIILCFGD